MRGALTPHGKSLGAVVPILCCPGSDVLPAVPCSVLPLSLGFNLPLHVSEGSTGSYTTDWGTAE